MMPSPSRIPRCKASSSKKVAVKKDGLSEDKHLAPGPEIAPGKHTKQLKSPATSIIQRCATHAPENSLKNNRAAKKQIKPSDRRGISEIKRSEQNLMHQIEALEGNMESIKHELESAHRKCDEDKIKIGSMVTHADGLEKDMNELQIYNNRLLHTLESNNVDPVTGNVMKLETSFIQSLKSCEDKGVNREKEILKLMNELDNLCDETMNRLTSIVIP